MLLLQLLLVDLMVDDISGSGQDLLRFIPHFISEFFHLSCLMEHCTLSLGFGFFSHSPSFIQVSCKLTFCSIQLGFFSPAILQLPLQLDHFVPLLCLPGIFHFPLSGQKLSHLILILQQRLLLGFCLC